jgi:hypothetical protein
MWVKMGFQNFDLFVNNCLHEVMGKQIHVQKDCVFVVNVSIYGHSLQIHCKWMNTFFNKTKIQYASEKLQWYFQTVSYSKQVTDLSYP